MMMNKKRSSKLELSKYAFLLPIVIFIAGAFTVDKTEAKIEQVVQTVKKTDLQEVFQSDSVLSVKMNGEAGEVLKEAFGSDTVDIKIEGRAAGVKISADSLVEGIPENALIIIDDVQSDRKNLNRIGADRISGSLILSTADAIARFGEKGKNGAVLVATKKEKSQILVQENSLDIKTRADIDRTKVYLYLYDSKPISKSAFFALPNAEVNDLRLIGKQSASIMYTNVFPDIKNMDGVIRAVSAEQKKIDNERFKNALIVVDGDVKEKGVFEMNSINANDIESVTILKGGSGTSLYGEKAKDGVIEITTKKNKRSSSNTPRDTTKAGEGLEHLATTRGGVMRILFDEDTNNPNTPKKIGYVLDGAKEILATNVLKFIPKEEIELMTVLKQREIKDGKYDGKGFDAVVEIQTKNGDGKKLLEIGREEDNKRRKELFASEREKLIATKKAEWSLRNPLYVVNGKVKKEDSFDINVFNPIDIESINILKDRSATSSYGKNGKNGVVEITLRKGVEEKYRLLDSGYRLWEIKRN